MSPSAAPPSPQEIQRKLSVHSVAKSSKPSVAPISGTESDSDSALTSDILSPSSHGSGLPSSYHTGTSSQPPLSSIAERRSGSGEDTEDEEDEEDGWKTTAIKGTPRGSFDETVIKAGYLWKKGERRKTWKKRWFVLRPAHLAYYKTSAEYQLLRLLELSDVHSCTPIALKKHENAFGLISPIRTYYLYAKTHTEMQEWVRAIEDTRQALMATSTQTSVTSPIPIPASRTQHSTRPNPLSLTPSPPHHPAHTQNVTSSDSEDASPSMQRTYSMQLNQPPIPTSPSRPNAPPKDPGKTVLSGYLMKCGSKRHNWRKRWFVLTGEKLIYSGSHMDTKPHRQFSFSEILDALEYELPTHRHHPVSPPASTPPGFSTSVSDAEVSNSSHMFKIVTTKRTLLLCAPSEEDEIKWLGAVRALIARRSGMGAVPGESGAARPTSDVNQSAPGITSGGIKSKVRRLSASGSGGFAGSAIPEEPATDT